ncbi:MAG: hypothetical protein ABGZ23_28230, partial [Fuerstiella sp.]
AGRNPTSENSDFRLAHWLADGRHDFVMAARQRNTPEQFAVFRLPGTTVPDDRNCARSSSLSSPSCFL